MAQSPGRNIRRGAASPPQRRPVSPSTPASTPEISENPSAESNGSTAASGVQRTAPRRAARPSSPGLSTLHKVVGLLLLVLLIAALAGYGPFMRYWHTRTLDTAATIDQRNAAAEALVARRDGSAFDIFQSRLSGADPLARIASANGMAILAKTEGSVAATEAISAAVPALKDPDKIEFAKALGSVAHAVGSSKAKEEDIARHHAAIAKGLIPLLANPDVTVRKASVDVLQELPAPGVCAALLPVATSDTDAALKLAACNALPATARPDAAPGLLTAMASTDETLKTKSAEAFAKVRRESKSEDLLPLVSSPSDFVRREIVGVLGKRSGDAKAAEGVTRALKDQLPEIRKLAVKCVPVTGVSGAMSQLLPLVSDTDETVRMATVEALGEMRDDNSKKVLLEAFASAPAGPTMDAMLKALARRANGKDLQAITVVMGQLDKHPETFKGLSEALVMLTNAQQGAKRETERRAWTAKQWTDWFDNIVARELLRRQAVEKLEKADARKQEDKKFYPELSKMTNEALDMLDKCIKLCEPNDPEDVAALEGIQRKYGPNKYLFMKSQSIDESHRK